MGQGWPRPAVISLGIGKDAFEEAAEHVGHWQEQGIHRERPHEDRWICAHEASDRKRVGEIFGTAACKNARERNIRERARLTSTGENAYSSFLDQAPRRGERAARVLLPVSNHSALQHVDREN